MKVTPSSRKFKIVFLVSCWNDCCGRVVNFENERRKTFHCQCCELCLVFSLKIHVYGHMLCVCVCVLQPRGFVSVGQITSLARDLPSRTVDDLAERRSIFGGLGAGGHSSFATNDSGRSVHCAGQTRCCLGNTGDCQMNLVHIWAVKTCFFHFFSRLNIIVCLAVTVIVWFGLHRFLTNILYCLVNVIDWLDFTTLFATKKKKHKAFGAMSPRRYLCANKDNAVVSPKKNLKKC